MNFINLIEDNYNIKVSELSFLDAHFGTEIYLLKTSGGNKYFVKKLPLYMEDVKNESDITDFLRSKGIGVPVLLKTKDGRGVLICDDFQLTIQSYIEGETLELNSASKDFLLRQAELLGKINQALSNYTDLPVHFDKKFFSKKSARMKCRNLKSDFRKAKKSLTEEQKNNWLTQIKHLEKISTFKIDTRKLTYANSHADFNIRQIIVNGDNLTVVDWSSARKTPACLDVITSYVFASKKSGNGYIDSEELKEYIAAYSKYYKLNEYDIKMMPYVFYFWHTMCNYYPNEEIAKNYKPLAKLINNTLDWLYDNVDRLSEKLNKAN